MTENTKKEWLEKIKKVGDVPTPYVLTDLAIIQDRAEKLQELLNNVDIYYAMKSNSHPKIISTLNNLVTGFEVASLGEWEMLRESNISPGRVLFSNPVKVPRHIAQTYKGGLRYYAFDSLDEIKKLRQLAPEATTYIRFQVSDYGSKFPLSKKYGLLPQHVVEYASFAQNLGLKVGGLTFHVGSQSENPKVWEYAFETSANLIKRLERAGITIELLDIGGGLPANYGQPIPAIRTICKTINKSIKKHIPSHVRIIAEPGRYFTAEASVLVTEVILREHRSGVDWLHLDMGAFQGLIEPLEVPAWRYPVFTDKNPRGYKKDFVLTGPSCDPFDTIGTDYSLPSEINQGDKIYIGSTGAYASVYGSRFNGFDIPETYFV